MELKNNKSALAALATIGVTAIAAGTTAFLKIRKKRREQQQEEQQQNASALSPDQMMVYNEAVQAFQTLNNRIYDLRSLSNELQPLIQWLVTDGERPVVQDQEVLQQLADDIDKFLTQQMPFINACLSTINQDGLTFVDYVHAPIGGAFDNTLDELPQDTAKDGTPIKAVLRIGYFFPDSTIAPQPVKSIVTV